MEVFLQMRDGSPIIGRWIWITQVMKVQSIPGGYIDLAGSEYSSVGQHLRGIFDLVMIRSCAKCGTTIRKKPFFPSSLVCATVEEHLKNVHGTSVVPGMPSHCAGSNNRIEYSFDAEPVPLYRLEVDYHTGANTKRLQERQVPKEVIIFGINYQLFAISLIRPAASKDYISHFTALFYTQDGVFQYNDLSSQLRKINKPVREEYVQSVYYVRSM